MDDVIRKYLKSLGEKGGAAGTGEKKRRGDSEFYRNLAKRKKKKAAG